MCGRFTIISEDKELEKRFGATISTPITKHYNAAPSQQLPLITNDKPKNIQLGKWGIKPVWLKNNKGTGFINARAETLIEKPSFKNAFLNRRCLVLSDSFFEWDRLGGTKKPFRILLKNEQPFAFAGIWEMTKTKDGLFVPSFSIITTSPNSLISKIHHRMPVILHQDDEQEWLKKEIDITKSLDLLQPYPTEEMNMYEVSSKVNSYANDVAGVIEGV
ncbi:SOS response-associated peptidase [Patescibacteria group bacterium]|nr:SOS response-associated peptidase [Patescibacteria group bacterium]MBU1890154.1 SOS response-associated peptidase [Patescibacteria group bacterium]